MAEQYLTQPRGGAMYKHAKRHHEHHNIEREKAALENEPCRKGNSDHGDLQPNPVLHGKVSDGDA
jgi:hypothetical protein